jgi:hypothetical protein
MNIDDAESSFAEVVVQFFRHVFQFHNGICERQETVQQVNECPWMVVEDVFENPVSSGIRSPFHRIEGRS